MAKKILIVEDEKSLSVPLEAVLAKAGFVTFVSQDGEEGLQDASSLSPDLILLDLSMPKVTGLEMLQRLRAQGMWGENMPVIILTNFPMENKEERREMDSLYPAAYLLKSDTSLEQVVKKVRDILKV